MTLCSKAQVEHGIAQISPSRDSGSDIVRLDDLEEGSAKKENDTDDKHKDEQSQSSIQDHEECFHSHVIIDNLEL